MAKRQLNTDKTGITPTANLGFLSSRKKAVVQALLTLQNTLYYVFSINNNSATKARQVVNAIYLDSLFNQYFDVSINNYPQFFVNPKTSGSLTIPLKSSTYQLNPVTINNLVTNLSSVTGTRIRYMPIGDSITAALHQDESGNNREFWNATSKATANILRDTIDNPSILAPVLLGHYTYTTRAFTYKGNSLTNKGGTAAQSGWAACQYLRHAIQITGFDVGSGLDRTIYGRPIPQICYHLLGLDGNGGGSWTGSTAQIELIRTTPSGKFSPTKNATLYDFLKVQTGWIGDNDTYTGTTTQNNNIDTFWESFLDNPLNPFYSKTKARTGGSTDAFSLTEYLNRFKTLADDGTTRLVVGSTAGTKVTNVNSYDVCTPTHVTLNFGENDNWLFPNASVIQIVADIRTIANAIVADAPSCKVGIWTNPRPSTNFPLLFPNGVRYPKTDDTLLKSSLRNAIISNLGITSSVVKTGNIYYIPVYECTYPCSRSNSMYAESADSQIDFEEAASSGVHFGLKGHASMGDQIYSWLYYSINN